MKLKTLFLISTGIFYLGSMNAVHDMASLKDATVKFIELKKRQKNAWFDFMKTEKTEKADLMQKHMNQWFDLKLNKMQSMPTDMKDMDMSKMLDMKKAHLMDAVKLYEQQGKDWEQLCMSHMQNAQALAKKTKDEFAAYKQQYIMSDAQPMETETMAEAGSVEDKDED